MPKQLFSVKEVAQNLQVSRGFVYDLIYSGRIKAIKLSRNRLRITDTALTEFLRQEEDLYAAVNCKK